MFERANLRRFVLSPRHGPWKTGIVEPYGTVQPLSRRFQVEIDSKLGSKISRRRLHNVDLLGDNANCLGVSFCGQGLDIGRQKGKLRTQEETDIRQKDSLSGQKDNHTQEDKQSTQDDNVGRNVEASVRSLRERLNVFEAEREKKIEENGKVVVRTRIDSGFCTNLNIEEFDTARKSLACCIDSRSEHEYQKGHIPGAFNVPVLTDEERAIVGKTYKQDGRLAAIEVGFRLVAPRAENIAVAAQKILQQQAETGLIRQSIGVYCARGGLRSNLLGYYLKQALNIDVVVLNGGYKAFRQNAVTFDYSTSPIVVLAGRTGSGKTRVLKSLKEMGEQVVDLEFFARHYGSAFGHVGQRFPQPTSEHFANLMFDCWNGLNPERPVFVEDEGSHIGCVHVPTPLHEGIRKSRLVLNVIVPKNIRIATLCNTYAGADVELEAAILRLTKKVGKAAIDDALIALRGGDYARVADIFIDYYDGTYGKQLKRGRESACVHDIEFIGSGYTDSTSLSVFYDNIATTLQKKGS